MKAIKIGPESPFVIRNAARAINERLAEIGEESLMIGVNEDTMLLATKEIGCFPGDDGPKHWYIATQDEDGGHSTVYKNGRWYYREPVDGYDRPVPGGINEVVDNWVCYFTG